MSQMRRVVTACTEWPLTIIYTEGWRHAWCKLWHVCHTIMHMVTMKMQWMQVKDASVKSPRSSGGRFFRVFYLRICFVNVCLVCLIDTCCCVFVLILLYESGVQFCWLISTRRGVYIYTVCKKLAVRLGRWNSCMRWSCIGLMRVWPDGCVRGRSQHFLFGPWNISPSLSSSLSPSPTPSLAIILLLFPSSSLFFSHPSPWGSQFLP